MARDYSARRNNPPDSQGKRKPTKRAAPAAKPVRKKSAPAKKSSGSNSRGTGTPLVRAGMPGCIWLVCGMLLAIVFGSIYYIASRPAGHGPESVSIDVPDANQTQTPDNSASSKDEPTDTTKPEQPTRKPRFSFYKMLPNYKVEVPAGEKAGQAEAAEHTPHEAEPAPDTPAPSTASPPAASASNSGGEHTAGGYMIQAGAFSTRKDADHRKAQLALLGVSADIVDVTTSAGKTVYRVQSNVLPSGDKARTLAQRLQSHGIETMVRQAR